MIYKDKEGKREYNKKWYQAHKDKQKAYMKEWYQAHKDEQKTYYEKYFGVEDNNKQYRIRNWKKYNIKDPERYEELYENAKGQCEICNRQLKRYATDSGDYPTAQLDHDPKTGFSRGILCDNCNKGLGFIEDCLKNAEDYIATVKDRKEYVCSGSHHWMQ